MIEQQPMTETTVPMDTTVLRLSDAAATKLRELTLLNERPEFWLQQRA